ncbi:hypothetical protein E2562_031133 [Oryza meyeriana var. granulata]|uniref:Uncharacterized protein n=1 Tax=Oryza meyeriana var. granulata TaxID=110450 RepID=A0A6G1DR30_9ORYZ|nr:hypothetical protein E2562_031133 [Oryza meyeriana var. granulata]
MGAAFNDVYVPLNAKSRCFQDEMELVERINFVNEDEGHVITRFIMARDNKGKQKVQEGKKVGGSSRFVRRRLDTSDDPASTTDTSASRPQRRSTRTTRICYNEARMGEPAPPEPSEPNPCESNDAMASDQSSKEQEGSPVHPDNLLEARDSPHRDNPGLRPPCVDYTCYKATGIRRLRQVPEADWFPTARDPHGMLGNMQLWTRV